MPLIGYMGCISYYHALALRQLGYPMLGKPEDNALKEMILNDMGVGNSTLLHKIIQEREKIYTRAMS